MKLTKHQYMEILQPLFYMMDRCSWYILRVMTCKVVDTSTTEPGGGEKG